MLIQKVHCNLCCTQPYEATQMCVVGLHTSLPQPTILLHGTQCHPKVVINKVEVPVVKYIEKLVEVPVTKYRDKVGWGERVDRMSGKGGCVEV